MEEIVLVSGSTYLITAAILVIFAEPLYNKVREGELPQWLQSLWAQAVISYYRVKTDKGDTGDWAYCLVFPAGVASSVTLMVFAGLFVIGTILAVAVVLIVLAMLFSR